MSQAQPISSPLDLISSDSPPLTVFHRCDRVTLCSSPYLWIAAVTVVVAGLYQLLLVVVAVVVVVVVAVVAALLAAAV